VLCVDWIVLRFCKIVEYFSTAAAPVFIFIRLGSLYRQEFFFQVRKENILHLLFVFCIISALDKSRASMKILSNAIFAMVSIVILRRALNSKLGDWKRNKVSR